ncbi:tyrosine-type recombinase/integrase [Nitrolancea hollandica]|uniref:Phage integrase n=1 Tax=Nitrolancea hollandica Lb TaxID=1129897 RepID=I4ELJ5_9BACT|nr:tyrosine-type recombinase/integrase [Nitrolancea hollandica]CCF85557.1 Phage integrase [Nitrolancea hollandica Lb]
MASRRGHGEGSIYQRDDGRWCASVNLGYVDGKRKRKDIYGKTRKEVAEKLKIALREQQQGLPVAVERQTVGQFFQHWLTTVARHTVRESTWDSYEMRVRRDVLPHLGRKQLAKLTPQDLTDLYSRLLAQGLAPATVQRTHAIIHRALKQAARWGLVGRNVADLVDAPRPAKHEITTLDRTELDRFLMAARGDRFYALYVLAVFSGMREGELLGLRWADVDFDAREVRARRQAGRTKTGMRFSEPKTAKGRRSVALPDLAIDALREHRRSQLEARLATGPEWEDHDLVFPNLKGKPVERQNLARRSFKPILRRTGLPDSIRFHDLRHAHATMLLSAGVHPKVVQERLGHSTIGVTMDIYSHVMPQMQRDAADRLDHLFAAAE